MRIYLTCVLSSVSLGGEEKGEGRGVSFPSLSDRVGMEVLEVVLTLD